MKDIWKSLAVEELELYPARKEALKTIPERIRELELAYISIGSPSADKISVQGGKENDKALNNIAQREALARNYAEANQSVSWVERGLNVLNDEETELISRCYMHPEPRAVERIAQARGVERNTVYRKRDDALRKFSVAMFG